MNLSFLHYAQMGAKKKASGGAPSNEIWYTSTDGNIVKPYKTSAFNVSIVSNTYTDGKGVITFNGDVTMIGASAFLDRTNLASITLPDGVMTIERDAFYYCERLASINIPEGVTTIGVQAFYKCTSLASVYITDITAWCQISFSSSDSNPMYYGADLYLNNVKVEHLVIPDGVTTIGQYAFYGCGSLASVTLPESVTRINNRAFLSCTSLKSVYCKPTTPPMGGLDIFGYNASDRKIYVPAGSANAYKAAAGWRDFAADIVEEA